MAFTRNDVVFKNRLNEALEETNMGFEHNDIVTVNVMEKAIEESGGGGVFSVASVALTVNAGDGGGGLDGGINGLSEGYAFAKGYPEVSGLVTAAGIPAGESGTLYAVLAGGGARYAVIGTVVSTSGDVEISEGAAIITGDCSITLDPVS